MSLSPIDHFTYQTRVAVHVTNRDALSHKAGDAVLVTVADRLSKFIGSNGVVARLGGDEFATVIAGVRTNAQALRLGTEIAKLIRQPITFEYRKLEVGASVGVALSQTAHDTSPGSHLVPI